MRRLQAESGGTPAVAGVAAPIAAVPAAATVEPSPSAAHAADLSLARAAVETVVRVGLMLALAGWCLWITRPFIFAMIWGIIIAVAINPGYQRVKALLGGRGGLAAGLMASSILVVLVWPVSMLTSSLIANLSELAIRLMDGSLRLPPPPAGVEQWPLIGPRIEQLWTMGSAGLGSVLEEIQPQLRVAAGWLLSVVADLGLGLLHFVAAMIIAGILLAHAEGGHRLASDLATRLVGARGPGLAALSERTIRGVARGIIGTAMVQSAAAGVGFMVAGVPWAALLVLVCFLLCLVQIGPAPVLLGTVIWMYSTADTATASLFLAWCVFVGMIDNVLRPLLIGRGSDVPLAVILLGVLGGLLAHGLIGLFVGPIVLALGHQLFRAWLGQPAEPAGSPPD